jgi:hypothetical protein
MFCYHPNADFPYSKHRFTGAWTVFDGNVSLNPYDSLMVQLAIDRAISNRVKEWSIKLVPLSDTTSDPTPCVAVVRHNYKVNVLKLVVPSSVSRYVAHSDTVSMIKVADCIKAENIHILFRNKPSRLVFNMQEEEGFIITHHRAKMERCLAKHFQKPRLLALVMGLHTRLGVTSHLKELDDELMVLIAGMAFLGSPYV